MPLIARVGRRSARVRLLVAALYAILTAGAVTMVYPFLIMISGSFKSSVDQHEFDILPAFFTDDAALYRKHIECKYNNSPALYRVVNRSAAYDFRSVTPPDAALSVGAPVGPASPKPWPETVPVPGTALRRTPPDSQAPDRTDTQIADSTPLARRAADWREFERSRPIPPAWYAIGYMVHSGDRLELRKQREFRRRLMRLCDGDLETLRQKFEIDAGSWLAVGSMAERITDRRYQLAGGPFESEFLAFKQEQPALYRIYPSLDGVFVQTLLQPVYGTNTAAWARDYGLHATDYAALALPARAPANPAFRRDWERFVRQELNLNFVRIDPAARGRFAAFLEARYAGSIDTLNTRYGTQFPGFADVPYPSDLSRASVQLADWSAFVREVPLEALSITSPEIEYRGFLRTKYGGDIAALNATQGSAHAGFESVPLPAAEVDYAGFLEHCDEIRREFMTANYRQVADYIFLHGHSLRNTVIYCLLSIVLTLTVNPLAAYALSRYRIPSAYRILLFCMATMAFPPAVSMIPHFLMIKQLGLLNTFGALLLPVMANGFNIFLLKGFFDSLPRELYESAQLDGAGEWTMFWNLTMALSKPILAVLALGAFNAAYGNFMFAFLLCPDERMWTLMVFLYQLQINGHQGLTFAALLVAAIPTFLIFVLCQRFIIRGIVVPVEK